MITTSISNVGKRPINVVPLKLDGSNGTIDTQDTAPTVEYSEDEDGPEGAATASVTVAEDGSLNVEAVSGTIAEGKTVRTTVLTIKADADLDAGESREISETLVIVTTRAEAQGFGKVTEGAEVAK